MNMKEFIIKLDLTNFFKDERKRSLLLVDPKWNEVSDLAKRIETIFDLKDIRLLTEDGCYVPLEEPIRVVATEKALKAFVLELNSSGTTDKKNKKRKFFSVDDVEGCSTPYQETKPKRSKSQKIDLNDKHEAATQEVSRHNNKSHNNENEELVEKVPSLPGDCSEVNDIVANSIIKASKKKKSLINKNDAHLLQNPSNVTSSWNDEKNNSSSKSKTKKNKSCSFVNGTFVNEEFRNVAAKMESQSSRLQFHEVEEDEQLNNVENTEPQNSSIQDYDKNITANDHTTTLVRETPTKINFRCALLQMDDTITRTFNLRPKANVSNVEILEDIRILPVNNSLLSSASVVVDATINSMEKSKMSLSTNRQEYSSLVSSVILLDDTKIDESYAAIDVDAASSEVQISQLLEVGCGVNDEIEVMLRNSKSLDILPSVGDVLLFKIIDKEILSDYIAGNCDYINRRSKLVTVSLINFPKGSENILNRFCANIDGPSSNIDGPSSNIEKIMLKFTEMIDLKLVNMN